jgi:hypothetical protein
MLHGLLPRRPRKHKGGETSLRREARRAVHISDEDLAALLDKTISMRRCSQIVTHLANCPDCRKAVSQTVASRCSIEDPKLSSI